MTRDDVPARVAEVRDRIAAAARRSGRSPSDITLVAVSKTVPLELMIAALESGVADLGENRVQELSAKRAVVGDRARWHFVGHLQKNKVRHVVGVHLIHSVDRAALGESIASAARRIRRRQEVLVQVNIGREASKSGVDPERASAFTEELARLDGLIVRGLMAIPPAPARPEASRPFFATLAALRDTVVRGVPTATELSMGMTRDFEVAIEEGATIVRVGEAVFGPRPPVGGAGR